jgi:hypothetical protein
VKLVHLVGFITKEICYDARSHERKIRRVLCLKVPKPYLFVPVIRAIIILQMSGLMQGNTEAFGKNPVLVSLCPSHEQPRERTLSSAIWKRLSKKHIKDQSVPHRDTYHLHYGNHPVNVVLGTHYCSSEDHMKYTKYTV